MVLEECSDDVLQRLRCCLKRISACTLMQAEVREKLHYSASFVRFSARKTWKTHWNTQKTSFRHMQLRVAVALN